MEENPYESPKNCDACPTPLATPKTDWRVLAIVLSVYALADVVGYSLLRPYIVLIHSLG
jgi:hypothetical protein